MNTDIIYKLLKSPIKADILIALEIMIDWDREQLIQFSAKYKDKTLTLSPEEQWISQDFIELNCVSSSFWMTKGEICLFCGSTLEILDLKGWHGATFRKSKNLYT